MAQPPDRFVCGWANYLKEGICLKLSESAGLRAKTPNANRSLRYVAPVGVAAKQRLANPFACIARDRV